MWLATGCVLGTNYVGHSTLEGYHIYRKDRMARGEGVAITTREGIPHTLIEPDQPEVIGLEVNIGPSIAQIFSLYIPPDKTPDTKYYEGLIGQNTPTFLLGDFNCRHRSWNCFRANKNGRLEDTWLQTMPRYCLLSPRTYNYSTVEKNRNPSTINLVLTNKPQLATGPETIDGGPPPPRLPGNSDE